MKGIENQARQIMKEIGNQAHKKRNWRLCEPISQAA
jgi:hypothetical protein